MTARAPRVLLGVTGGIAAYKSAEVIRRLRDLQCDVTVAATASAHRFVGEATWAALSGRPVLTNLWQHAEVVGHVSAARSSDVILVAPATADFMARLVHGRSDDVLSAIVLMAQCPVVIAPAMHTEMWLDPTTQCNVASLRSVGMLVLDPAKGRLTGPDDGPGRLPAPESLADIAYCAAQRSNGADLAGQHVVVSAGGTREAWDPVRWLGNRSSGRMGYAVAAAAVARGARVTVIAANVDLPDVAGAQTVAVSDHAHLEAAVQAAALTADAVVMAAAVADFTIAAEPTKIKKHHDATPSVQLLPTTDVLAGLAARRQGRHPILIGFAAETAKDAAELEAAARQKLASKKCDAIVANDVSESAVFGKSHASVLIAHANGSVHAIHDANKLDIAQHVCDLLVPAAQ